jgi:cobalt-zinc-cadmium efflux system protein
MWLLRAGATESLNIRSAYLEVLADALGSVGVIVAAVIIQISGNPLADSVISAAIGLFILPRTWGLMRQAIHVLMEGVPPHLDPLAIQRAMEDSHGVRAVHDLHVWTLTSGRDALSAHVRVDDLADGRHVLGDLQQILHDRFGIEHVTIQLDSDAPLLQIGRAPSTGRPPPGGDRAAAPDDGKTPGRR